MCDICEGGVQKQYGRGPVVATYTTTNTSQTEIIQTGLQCATNYYIRVVVSGGRGGILMLSPIDIQMCKCLLEVTKLFACDCNHTNLMVVMPLHSNYAIPVGVRAEVTTGNTIIRVSWQWSCQGVLDFVRVDYQPEGGSLMMYTVNNTTVTSVTLSNLQCNTTEYTVWVYARSGQIKRTSSPSKVSLHTRGMYIIPILCIVYCIVGYTIYHPSPSHSH